MTGPGTKRPEGVAFNALSESVFAILSRHTAFPWPVLMTQAKRCGANPVALTPADLPLLAPLLAAGVERYTSPAKGVAVRAALLELSRQHRSH